jgi:outer membrane protein
MTRALLAVLVLLPSFARAASTDTPVGRPITLSQAYGLALARSEELSQRRHGVEELEQRIRELWSNVKPRLALTGTQTWQDTPGETGGASSSFTQTSRPQAAVTLHQPLFSGLREFLALKATRAQDEAAQLQLKRAQELLYQDVAAAYVNLLSLHLEMRSRQALIDLTEDRIKELRSRERIGRSRESEVLAAQSQQAQAVSDLEAARGQERTAQAILRFLTGLEEDLFPADLPVPGPELLQPFLDRARRRADVSARLKDVDASRSSVSVQSRQRLPTVSFDGNYYLKRPTGFSEHIRWDAILSASLPLYYGGAISAQTGQAKARLASAEDALSLALRAAERDVRQTHSSLDSSLSVVAALERALTLADANAKAQTADYRLGLVTNLDVISALNTALETRLRRDRAKLQAALARVQLEVAAGGLQ